MAGVRLPIDVNDEHRDRFESALPPARLLARRQVASCLLPNKGWYSTSPATSSSPEATSRARAIAAERRIRKSIHSSVIMAGKESSRIVSFLGFTGMKAASCFGK
jgi:hypothetical protein